jgi:AAA15 family ATPase/GTPase
MNNKYDIFLNSEEQPDFKNYILFGEGKEIDVLPNFNTINILVGSNNSGKSRFMRTMMKQQEIRGFHGYKLFEKKLKELNHIINDLKINWFWNQYMHNHDRIEPSLKTNITLHTIYDEPSQIFSQTIPPTIEANKNAFQLLEKIFENRIEGYYYQMVDRVQIGIAIDQNFLTKLAIASKLNDELTTFFSFKKFEPNTNYFIPTLRTAHSLFENTAPPSKSYKKYQKDIFLETVLKNYELEDVVIDKKYNPNAKLARRIFIFTGLQLYNEIVNARNGTKEERKRFDDFEKFIGKQFFNTSIDIVAKFNYNEKHENKDDKETINIHIGEASRNLHDLGDGIQALIILMYSIFMAPNDTMVFIDEPELNLHPGMQRLFLEQTIKT